MPYRSYYCKASYYQFSIVHWQEISLRFSFIQNSAYIIWISNVLVTLVDVIFFQIGEEVSDSSVTGDEEPEFESFSKERWNGWIRGIPAAGTK